MTEGWIRIHRKIFDNSLWFSEPFTKSQAWIDILLITSHHKTTFFVRGNEITLQRGQFAYAERTLAKRWSWSREKVRRFLKWLETRQQIRPQKNNILSIYTVINYNDYQSNGTINKTTDQTTEKPQKNQYNNDKNVNNIYNRFLFLKNKKDKTDSETREFIKLSDKL